MEKTRAIVDTGFVVAALDCSDQWHAWAAQQFPQLAAPALTCEAVVSEACFLLRDTRGARGQLMAWIRSGGLEVVPMLPAETDPVAALLKRFDPRIDYADACLVRLSELRRNHVVVTTDRADFHVYRRFRRERLPLLTP